MNTLGGVIFIRNNRQFDYHVIESIQCLMDLCDQVVVVDAGSTDGTTSDLLNFFVSINASPTVVHNEHQLKNNGATLKLIALTPDKWHEQRGKEKLAYFQNIGINHLETDYTFLLQADECVHEHSFAMIRELVNTDFPAFLCKRINLWGSPDHMLNVEHERMPCSDIVLRLAKRGHMSYGDGESLECYPVSSEYVNMVNIIHTGFVRDRRVMVNKIRHMQKDVFEINPDTRLEGMELFNPFAWFNKEDLKELNISHPKYVKNWLQNKRKEYKELW